MHPRAVDTAFAKAFNLLGKMGPRELRDKMEEMGYKPGTGLFKELLKSRGKSRFKDGGSVRPIIKVDKDGKIRQTGKKRFKDGTISVQPEGGIKFIPNKKDGGLMEAIEKIKAKEMKEGGEAGKGGELLRVVKELEVLERPEKERRKFLGRRKMLSLQKI